MALQFPSNPSIGDIYSSGSSAIYEFNGSYWDILEPTNVTVEFANSASVATTASYAVSVGKVITEPISYRSTAGALNKPTFINTDNVTLVDDGSGWCSVDIHYSYSDSTGATPDTGDRLYKLPGGYSFDTSVHITAIGGTQLIGENGYAYGGILAIVPTSGIIVDTTVNWSNTLAVVPYNSTEFRIGLGDNSTAGPWDYVGAWFNNNVPTTLRMSFRFKKG
jgi:hypothetical protein